MRWGAEPGSRLHQKGCHYQGRGQRAQETCPTWFGKGAKGMIRKIMTGSYNSARKLEGSSVHPGEEVTAMSVAWGCISCLPCTQAPDTLSLLTAGRHAGSFYQCPKFDQYAASPLIAGSWVFLQAWGWDTLCHWPLPGCFRDLENILVSRVSKES